MVGAAVTVLGILDVLLDMDDRNTQRNQQIRVKNQEMELREKQAKADRNLQYLNAAVDIISKGADIFLKYKAQQQQNAPVTNNNNFVKSLPPIPSPSPSNYLNQPVIEIEYNSVCFDQSNNIMSANVIDRNSGQFHFYAYHIQNISDSQRNILESVDGNQWNQVGVLDSRTAAADIGSSQAGGYIFGEIFKTVLEKTRQKQVPPVPQIPQIEQTSCAPQINRSPVIEEPFQTPQIAQNSNVYQESSESELTYEETVVAFALELSAVYGNIPNVYFITGEDKAVNKFKSAINSYAPLNKYSEIPILIFDDTVFGGADDGFLISDEAIYFHNAFENNIYRFSRDQISCITCDYDKSDLYINGKVRLHPALLNGYPPQIFDTVINMIRDALRLEF